MRNGMRWPSELDVNKTTARISTDSMPASCRLPAIPFARQDGPAPNDGSRPRATGKYPQPIYALVGLCKAAGLPIPVPEYEFHPTRKWRFDYAIPQWKVGIEIEGGIWQRGGGGHSHPTGIVRDMEKYNAAAVQGWRVLRYAPEDLNQAIVDLRAL
jgi:hypothetical protein